MRTFLTISMLVTTLAACRSLPAEKSVPGRLDRAAAVLTGSFSSSAQAVEDPENYFDIHLVTVPIWTEREDGPWLYVEQAATDTLERPYRQRVYHLVAVPEGVRSDVYALPGDPLMLAGAWRTPASFDALTPDLLSERTGCSIHLVQVGDSWMGATFESDCVSTLRGAAYATSEVELTPTYLRTWDRGYDVDDSQVWGATEGPYVFMRETL